MLEDKLIIYTCKRCGHKWLPRIASPATCPNCKSRKWDEPTVLDHQKQIFADSRKRKLYEGGRGQWYEAKKAR